MVKLCSKILVLLCSILSVSSFYFLYATLEIARTFLPGVFTYPKSPDIEIPSILLLPFLSISQNFSFLGREGGGVGHTAEPKKKKKLPNACSFFNCRKNVFTK